MGLLVPAPADILATPLVSVIVPVYNGRSTISECLESLLTQDYPREKLEIIVADNGSTDDTAEIARALRARVVRADRVRSSYAARNDGARESAGELLAFCDADEVATPGWLRRLVAEVKDGYGGAAGPFITKDTGFAGAVAEYAAGDANFWPSDTPTDIRLAATGNVVYRRDVFEKLGGFREDTRTGADFDFSLRVTGQLGQKIRFVPEAVVWHHPRGTLGALLRHEARIAYGREWVCQQHGEPRDSATVLLATLATKILASTAAASLSAIRRPLERVSWRRARFILIHPMMVAANTYGRLRYRLKQEVPRHW